MAILRSSATRIGCTALSIPTCSGISHFHQLRRILRTVAPRHWSAWLYPRSRGENTLRTNDLPAVYGSSPLTRGKLWNLVDEYGNRGLIPAHAGKTRRRGESQQLSWAHPRSRGENPCRIVHVSCHVGSSPLTRGKSEAFARAFDLAGLIPAHAGKMPRTDRRPSKRWAHPRSRGENAIVGRPDALMRGSSPLTRGKCSGVSMPRCGPGLIPAHAGKISPVSTQIESHRAHPRSRGENRRCPRHGDHPQGLIPAHAGKIIVRARPAGQTRAHPRSRGENNDRTAHPCRPAGSSPLTRGKCGGAYLNLAAHGLIPAHAGKMVRRVGVLLR